MLGLAIGIVGLLILPKFLILAEAALTGRVRGFGGLRRALASVAGDLALSSLIAPILMAFQSRSVIEVLRGVDWGWPATRRGSDELGLAESFAATRFVVALGLAGMVAAPWAVPGLLPWLLPVLVPMIAAPALVSWTSRPAGGAPLFLVPSERDLPEILRRHDAVVERWPLADGPLADGPLADGPQADGPQADWPQADGPLADGPAAVRADPVQSAGHPATGTAETAHAPA